MEQRDLRTYLESVKKDAPDEIKFVNKTVDPKFELSAILAKLESLNRYPAVVFNRVHGFSMPVVSNLFSTRKRLAMALGCEEKELNPVFRTRENHRIEPRRVHSGPVKEVILKKEEIDLTRLPLVTHNEKDVAPYLTAGAMVVKDPETGIRNVGIYRHMLQGKEPDRRPSCRDQPFQSHFREILQKRKTHGSGDHGGNASPLLPGRVELCSFRGR